MTTGLTAFFGLYDAKFFPYCRPTNDFVYFCANEDESLDHQYCYVFSKPF